MEKSDLFRNLLFMAAADGVMSESELRLLSEKATQWGVTDDQFEAALEDAIIGDVEMALPTSDAERSQMMKEMIRIMAADGKLADGEKKLFAICSAHLNISGDMLNQLIDEVVRDSD